MGEDLGCEIESDFQGIFIWRVIVWGALNYGGVAFGVERWLGFGFWGLLELWDIAYLRTFVGL